MKNLLGEELTYRGNKLVPPPDWVNPWTGMPSYDHVDLESYDSIRVHLRTPEDRIKFLELVGQKVPGSSY